MSAFARMVESFAPGQPEVYLGNGIIGYRIKPNPFTSWKAAAAGFVKQHEEGRFETLACAPYPFAVELSLNGSPADVSVRRQTLNMSTGELTTEMAITFAGRTTELTVLQFLSRTCPALSCQEIRLKMPRSGELQMVFSVVCGPGTIPDAFQPPRHERVVDLMVGFSSNGNLSRCGVSLKLGTSAEALLSDPDPERPASRTYRLNVAEDQELVIREIAATVTSAYHPEPDLESCRLVNWGESIGFDRLRELNKEAWNEIWKSRVKVTGDEWAQKYLDSSLFYLYSSAHASCRSSLPPFGLSQALENYYGHVFWDTDTYIMPTLLLGSPETAGMTVDYRLRCLEAAKKRAQCYGYKGAMYPWESDTRGYESTPSACATGWLEQHVNMCVAAGTWWYQKAAGDEEHARESTWPILKSVAEWVESRCEKTARGYEIRNIMGSNEGDAVNNNCYVNALCAQVLRDAFECAAIVGKIPGAHWNEIAEAMFIPVGPAPEGSGVEGDVIYVHDGDPGMGSSSDTFYLAFPFDLPFDRDLLRRTYRLHRNLEPGVVSMGYVFHVASAAFAGDRLGCRVMFDHASRSMSEPVWGMGTEYSNATITCFLTSMGGLLQVAMMAFTGIRFEPGNWAKYEACLPDGWDRIEIERIYLGGRPYRLEAEDGRKAVLTLLEP